jgi:hypothetical protein
MSGISDLRPRWPSQPSLTFWFQLSNWFQTRRFLCEFPIGSYVKQSSGVGAILVEGLNRLTYFRSTPLKPLGQTLVDWSFGVPLPKLCPVILTSNQVGRQAKNRKRGDEIKKKIFSSQWFLRRRFFFNFIPPFF